MLSLIISTAMLVAMMINNEPLYAIAAGLFQIAGVLQSLLRPRRLVKTDEGKEESNIHKGGLY